MMAALPRPAHLVLGLLAAAVLLSGCSASNSGNGQTADGPGSLAYNGADTGSQTSKPLPCDGSGDVHVSANIGSGSVTFTVKDGSGKAVYTKTVSSAGQAAEEKAVTGAKGDWVVSATRSATSMYGAPGTFSGQYAAHLTC